MAFITVEGEQLIAEKIGNEEVLEITHFVLAYIDGLGAEPSDRIEAMPAVEDIVAERAVTALGYINANQVVYSLAMDSTVGTFTFNWVGLKAADGELVAVAHIEPQIKTATVGAVPGNNLTRNFLLAYSGIQATTAIAVPAETWQIDFTTRLLQIDERERLSNFDIYGQGAFFGDGFKVVFVSGSTYRVTAGLGYVGGIRCNLEANSDMTVSGLPKGIWLDASLQGDINGVSEVVVLTSSAAALTDYTDSLGFEHFVFKIADIPSAGLVTDLRPPAPVYLRRDDIVPQSEAEAGTATTPRAWTAQRVRQALSLGFEITLGAIGYIKLPNWMSGLIIQWGWINGVAASGTHTFLKPYSTACYFVLPKNTNPNLSAAAPEVIEVTYYDNPTTTQFKWVSTNMQTGALAAPGHFSFISIGK